MLTVVGDGHDPAQAALATLVAAWLVGDAPPDLCDDDPSDAPPLNRWAVAVIWNELQQGVQ